MSSTGVEFFKINKKYVNCNIEQDLTHENDSEIDEKELNHIRTTLSMKYEDYPKSKCGEIYMSNNGNIYLACSFCDLNFEKAEYFKNHMFEKHLKSETEYEGDSISVHSPPILSENECMKTDDEEAASYRIYDYANASVMDEDPIKVETVDDTLYGSSSPEYENDDSSIIQTALAANKKHATAKIDAIPDPDLYCEICKKQFITKKAIASHKERHEVTASYDIMHNTKYQDTDEDESQTNPPVKTVQNSLKCLYCSKQFKNTSERIYHERMHTGEKPFKCQNCGKVFRSKRQLVSHMRTHTGERPYSCPHCPSTFSNSANRNVHVRAHLGIKRFSCELCNKKFGTSTEKTVHLRSHTGEKPFQCETCGASYTTSSKLSEHNKRHADTKSHRCDICRRCFYSKKLLKCHEATHSDLRPFECNQCGASFTLKRGLRTHMKIHSDVKEYVCKICGKAFSQNAGLYCHMKSHGHRLSGKTDEVYCESDES